MRFIGLPCFKILNVTVCGKMIGKVFSAFDFVNTTFGTIEVHANLTLIGKRWLPSIRVERLRLFESSEGNHFYFVYRNGVFHPTDKFPYTSYRMTIV